MSLSSALCALTGSAARRGRAHPAARAGLRDGRTPARVPALTGSLRWERPHDHERRRRVGP